MADAELPDDWADRHVARWRDHWIDVDFDDEVEAIVTRIGRIASYFRRVKQRDVVAEIGLQEFEYDTLHQLVIRDTPGKASPTELAADLDISAAGMTGRLDSMEKAGWVQRRTDPDDRRRVHVEVTRAGMAIWREAMALRGRAESDLVGELSSAERDTLARLLKRMTLRIEDLD